MRKGQKQSPGLTRKERGRFEKRVAMRAELDAEALRRTTEDEETLALLAARMGLRRLKTT